MTGAEPTVVWVDGSLAPADQARISPFDHGLLTGDGVFETLIVYGGKPFAVRRHLERLAVSCRGLGLDVPDPGVVRDAMAQVVMANRFDRARLRVTVTGGDSPLGSDRGAVSSRSMTDSAAIFGAPVTDPGGKVAPMASAHPHPGRSRPRTVETRW